MADPDLGNAATETHTAPLEEPNRVLVIGPSWVGDMVMAQSLFKALSRSAGTVVDVVTPVALSPLLSRMPEVRKAIPVPLQRGRLQLGERYRLARSLSGAQYTRAIVLPNSWKSALIPYLAGIALRTGYIGEQRWGLLNDARRLDSSVLPMTVQRFAALATNSPVPTPFERPELLVTPADQNKVMAKFGISTGTEEVLAMCPGAEYGPAKQWPGDHFAQVARKKLKEGWQVWLLGSNKDARAAEHINVSCDHQCLDLTGKTGLDEVVDLLSLASFVVANDSGLMHISAALGRPQVALFGSSDPAHTPPLSDESFVEYLGLSCSPCFQRECPLTHYNCLKGITAERVLTVIDAALEKT